MSNMSIVSDKIAIDVNPDKESFVRVYTWCFWRRPGIRLTALISAFMLAIIFPLSLIRPSLLSIACVLPALVLSANWLLMKRNAINRFKSSYGRDHRIEVAFERQGFSISEGDRVFSYEWKEGIEKVENRSDFLFFGSDKVICFIPKDHLSGEDMKFLKELKAQE